MPGHDGDHLSSMAKNNHKRGEKTQSLKRPDHNLIGMCCWAPPAVSLVNSRRMVR